MSRTAGGVEVHWNANPARGLYDDFKFK